MSISGMTGFARAEGALAGMRWIWEVKSVNGRGLDFKLRLPPGQEPEETPDPRADGTSQDRPTGFREGR